MEENIAPKRQERETEQSHRQHTSKCGWLGQASATHRKATASPCRGVNETFSDPRPWKQKQVTHRGRRVAYSILKQSDQGGRDTVACPVNLGSLLDGGKVGVTILRRAISIRDHQEEQGT